LLLLLPILAAGVVLNDSAPTPLRAQDVRVLSAGREIPPWRSWDSLPDSCFGAQLTSKFDLSTSPMLIRIPVQVPRAGRWWLVSDYGLFRPQVQCESRLFGPTDAPHFHGWSLADEEEIFPLDLSPSTKQIHLLVSDPRAKTCWKRLGMRLVPGQVYPGWIENRTLFNALIVGFSAAFVILAAYLWLSVQQAALGWYAAYLLGYLLWFVFVSGYCRSRYWPDSHAFASIAVACFCIFLAQLLAKRRRSPWMFRLLQWTGALNLVSGFGFVVGCAVPWIVNDAIQMAAYVGILVSMSVCAIDDPLARKLIFAMSPPIAATLLSGLTEANVFSNYAFKKQFIALCVLVENVVTTLILAREVLRREKRRLILERDFEGKVLEQSDKYRQVIAHDLHDDLSQRILAVRLPLHNESGGSVSPRWNRSSRRWPTPRGTSPTSWLPPGTGRGACIRPCSNSPGP